MLYLFFLGGLLLAAGGVLLLKLTGWTILWGGALLWLGGTLALLLLLCVVAWIATRFVRMDQPPQDNGRGYRRLKLFIMRLALDLMRIHIDVQGEEKMPEKTRFLLVGNHRSNVDPIVTVWALRKWDISFVTKPGIMKIPIAGRIIHRCGYLPLDRGDDRAALKTILRAADCIKRDLFSVGIYPEGTRNRMPGLLPFRNGAFKIAQRANAPVVVVRLDHTDALKKNYPLRPTRITLRICQVLPAEFVAAHSTNEIGDAVRRILCPEEAQHDG